MSGHSARSETVMKLPTELSDRLLKPFSRFLRIEASAAFLLLLATVVALVVSNSS